MKRTPHLLSSQVDSISTSIVGVYKSRRGGRALQVRVFPPHRTYTGDYWPSFAAMASSVRRPLLLNKAAATWRLPAEESAPTEAVARFHKTMPGYAPTPLVSLKDVASE